MSLCVLTPYTPTILNRVFDQNLTFSWIKDPFDLSTQSSSFNQILPDSKIHFADISRIGMYHVDFQPRVHNGSGFAWNKITALAARSSGHQRGAQTQTWLDNKTAIKGSLIPEPRCCAPMRRENRRVATNLSCLHWSEGWGLTNYRRRGGWFIEGGPEYPETSLSN